MTRAEEKATEYANSVMLSVNHRGDVRDAFWEGYELAEKDLALTWQDIRKITQLYNDVDKEFWERYFAQLPVSDEEIYQEVLRRYNEKR